MIVDFPGAEGIYTAFCCPTLQAQNEFSQFSYEPPWFLNWFMNCFSKWSRGNFLWSPRGTQIKGHIQQTLLYLPTKHGKNWCLGVWIIEPQKAPKKILLGKMSGVGSRVHSTSLGWARGFQLTVHFPRMSLRKPDKLHVCFMYYCMCIGFGSITLTPKQEMSGRRTWNKTEWATGTKLLVKLMKMSPTWPTSYTRMGHGGLAIRPPKKVPPESAFGGVVGCGFRNVQSWPPSI